MQPKKAALNRRTLSNPLANATWVMGRLDSVSNCLASSRRWVCQLNRRDAVLRLNHAAKLAGPKTQLMRESVEVASIVQAHRLRSAGPPHGRCETPHPPAHGPEQARAGIAGKAEIPALGQRRVGKEPACSAHSPGRADGTAVHARRRDADEKQPVEANVMRGQGSIASLVVDLHGRILTVPGTSRLAVFGHGNDFWPTVICCLVSSSRCQRLFAGERHIR